MIERLLEIQKIVNKLAEDIKNGNVRNPGVGLCSNIGKHLDYGEKGSDVVAEFSQGWPLHTGCDSFPVPAPREFRCCEGDAYYGTRDKYSGKYGEMRISLLHYMAGRIEQKIRDLEAIGAS